MPQGSIKHYDVNTHEGIIVSDDGSEEWEIDAEALESSMFRFFRTGQRVTFDLIDIGGKRRPRNLRIGLA